MALVEKSHGEVGALFRDSVSLAPASRIFALLASIAGLAAMAYLVAHGYWLAAAWTVAAGVSWVFLRGASAASSAGFGSQEED
jgi:hypothetical protein